MDIAFAVDSSTSIPDNNWQQILAFMTSFVNTIPKVTPDLDGTRFGIVSYATNAKVHFNFKPAMYKKDVLDQIARTPRQDGDVRRIDRALELVETDLFSGKGGARPGAKQVSRINHFNFDYLSGLKITAETMPDILSKLNRFYPDM